MIVVCINSSWPFNFASIEENCKYWNVLYFFHYFRYAFKWIVNGNWVTDDTQLTETDQVISLFRIAFLATLYISGIED